MRAVSSAFRVARLTLVAGVFTPVFPLKVARAVNVGNATPGDLQVHTNSDQGEYLVIAAGYPYPITLAIETFDPSRVAFWLLSAPGGTVIITWT